MKCPKCNDSPLLCKRPIFHIHETGRLHFTRHAVEMERKIDTVPGDEENAIYFCEGCGFSGSGEEVFKAVLAKHYQEEGDEESG